MDKILKNPSIEELKAWSEIGFYFKSMLKKFNYVYITTNSINGKQYIGDHSSNILEDEYLGSGKLIIKAINKYGKKKFKREIIEICESKEEAFNKQEKYINEYNTLIPNGYNISPKGGLGVKKSLSKKSIDRIRNKLLGRKDSKETRNKKRLSRLGNLNPMYGKNDQVLNAVKKAKSNKGKTFEEIFGNEKGELIKGKISKKTSKENNPMFGKKHSERTKEKMRGPKSDEHKEKLSRAKLKAIKKTCPYCNKSIDPSNYGRYHGNNCNKKHITL